MTETPTFISFGPAHVLTLVVILFAAVSIPLLARRLDLRGRYVLGVVIAAALLVNEITRTLAGMYVYGLPLKMNLPLHLCGIASLLTMWVLWRRSYRAFEVAYFWGIGGSIPALLTPDLAVGFPHPTFFRFFGGHGLIMLGVLYAAIVYGFRPRWRSIGLTVIATILLILVIAPINVLLDTNYLYLSSRPEQATLMDVLGPWPWYVAALFFIGIGVCVVCYLPFMFLEKGNGRPGTAP